jgi:hypothetical protein
VLSEVRARLRGKDSLFLFSSHSLHSFPFAFQWSFERRCPIRTLYRLAQDAAFNLRRTFSNISISSDEVKRRGWAVLNDGAHGFKLSTYYVMPEEQVRQLADVGLDVVEAMNAAGDQIDWRVPQSAHWLHYLCRIARNSV